MIDKPYLITRLNAWLTLIVGISFGLYDSTTTVYISYPYTYEFDWWRFMIWLFGSYCVSMVFYSLSELLKQPAKAVDKASLSLIDRIRLSDEEMGKTSGSETDKPGLRH